MIMEQLRNWIADEALTHDEASVLLGVRVATLRGWIYEGKIPRRLDIIAQIASVTKGRVRLEDWAELQQRRT